MRYFLLYIYKLTVHTIYLSLRLQTWNRDSALFFIMAIDYEEIDSKCCVNNLSLAVNKEADRFKSRPLFSSFRARNDLRGKNVFIRSLACAHIPY